MSNVEAIRTHLEESQAAHARIRKGIEELPQQTGSERMPTREDITRRRDEWVEKNRKSGESEAETRRRFWKEHPEAKTAARNAPRGKPQKERELTVGEWVTKAIDWRARAWHLEGRFFDVSIPELRSKIRKSV